MYLQRYSNEVYNNLCFCSRLICTLTEMPLQTRWIFCFRLHWKYIQDRFPCPNIYFRGGNPLSLYCSDYWIKLIFTHQSVMVLYTKFMSAESVLATIGLLMAWSKLCLHCYKNPANERGGVWTNGWDGGTRASPSILQNDDILVAGGGGGRNRGRGGGEIRIKAIQNWLVNTHTHKRKSN